MKVAYSLAGCDEGQACPFLAAVLQRFAHLEPNMTQGYLYYAEQGKQFFIHREVARMAYGDIPARHYVHHIDHDKLNNCASNLEILNPSDHTHKHRPKKKSVTCANCGEVLSIKNKNFVRSKRHYCSATCRDVGLQVVERPDAEALYHLLVTVNNWSAIGRMFGVSDNTIRDWSKKYQLDTSVCNGHKKPKVAV